MRSLLLVLAITGPTAGCEPGLCFGDSCSCYGDPCADDANAGCASICACRGDDLCPEIADILDGCALGADFDRDSCERELAPFHERACSQLQSRLSRMDCQTLDVACSVATAGCIADLLSTGLTACSSGYESSFDRTIVPCPSGECFEGVCQL